MSAVTLYSEKKKTLVPQLRFPGFEGEWQDKKLKDITTYVDYRGRAPIKTEDGYFLVTAKNIKKGFIDYECSKEYVAENNYSNVMSKGTPKIGDVLFTTEAPMGNVALVDNANIALAQRVIKFRSKEMLFNSYLLYYMLSDTFQKNISKKAIGTTVQGISGKELHQIKILITTLPEQQKIASFLSAVDEKIQQLSRKAALLEQYKKGVMQQLFSGKLRFKDENGDDYADWEEKKLGDIGTLKNGLNKDKTDFGFGSPFVNLMNVFGKSEIYNQEFDLVNSNEKEKILYNVLKGDVLFIRSSVKRSGVGETVIVQEDLLNTVYSGFLIRFRDDRKSLAQEFKKYCFSSQSFRDEILSYATSSANTNINQESLNKINIKLPCIEEQQKIANFLSGIDGKIENVNGELVKTQLFKKGLLQQLFV